MKILCICPIGIGNYLMFYPACALIKQNRPDIELHLLALRKPVAALAEGDKLWTNIYLIDPTKEKNAGKILALISKMRLESYDFSLSFFPSNTWQYNVFPFLCGAANRLNFSYHLKKTASLSFLNSKKLPVDTEVHDVDQNIRMASFFLDKDLSKDHPVFPPLYSESNIKKASELLDNKYPVYIAIHPGSSVEHGMDAKRWEPEKFGFLADHICEMTGAQALIFGGPDELELKQRTASVMRKPYRIIDPVDLHLTAALMKQCALCLCNDSGLMHIAACVGTPVVAMFGPTDEKRNGPYGKKHLVLRKNMDGFPLWTAKNVGTRSVPEGVDPRQSLNELTVDDAWNKVKPWLEMVLKTDSAGDASINNY